MTPITVWKRFDDVSRRFEFNHIEDGHVPTGQHIPTIKHEAQRRAWTRSTWVKFLQYLDNDNRITGFYDGEGSMFYAAGDGEPCASIPVKP